MPPKDEKTNEKKDDKTKQTELSTPKPTSPKSDDGADKSEAKETLDYMKARDKLKDEKEKQEKQDEKDQKEFDKNAEKKKKSHLDDIKGGGNYMQDMLEILQLGRKLFEEIKGDPKKKDPKNEAPMTPPPDSPTPEKKDKALSQDDKAAFDANIAAQKEGTEAVNIGQEQQKDDDKKLNL
jgi:hypothetical protein